MEKVLLSSALNSREAFSIFAKHLDPKVKSREYQIVMRAISDYYARDGDCTKVDPAVLTEQVMATLQNPKHKERFASLLAEVIALDSSPPNVIELVLDAKRNELADRVAVALANRDKDADELIDEYRELQRVSSLDDMMFEDVVFLDSSNIDEILSEVVSPVNYMKLYPLSVNSRVDQRLAPGHHILTYGLPEMGKTALNVTFSAGFCSQGKKVIYFINEDKNEDIYTRHMCCLSGMSYDAIRANPQKAKQLAMDAGLENLKVVGISPGNLTIIERVIELEEPDAVFIDQLMNLNEKGDGLTQVMGRGSRGARKLVKKYGILGVSTAQAADSASGKAVLDIGDVYMSNIEVPAQFDVMIGIGGTPDQLATGRRVLSFAKNKTTGDHNPVVVKLHPSISRYTDDA